MKTPLLTFAALPLVALLFTSCADSGDATEKTNDQLQENREKMNEARAESAEEWREERTEAVKEMRDLRENLASRLQREQERMSNGIKDADKKAETTQMITELGTNIARIDAALLKLDASTGQDWNTVKADGRRTADETTTWWDRQKDMVDQKTDADNDNDGK